jgi:hypothetical protein
MPAARTCAFVSGVHQKQKAVAGSNPSCISCQTHSSGVSSGAWKWKKWRS